MVRCGFDKDTLCSLALSKNRFAVLFLCPFTKSASGFCDLQKEQKLA